MAEFFSEAAGAVNLFPRTDAGWREPQLGALAATLSRWTLDPLEPALVSIPTGTGKTAVAMAAPWLLAAVPKRVLVVAPSVALRKQLADQFTSYDLLRRISVLGNADATPDVRQVSGREGDWEELRDADVVVALPHSISPSHYDENSKPPADLFDLVIVDEAHHAPSSTWRAILEHFAAPQLLLTATPRRRDGRRLPGTLAYYYPLRRALEEGFYRSITPLLIDVDNDVTKEQSDQIIASRAAALFREPSHVTSTLLVRAGSISRLRELEQIYRAEGVELTLLHNQLSSANQREIVASLIDGSRRTVGVVGMLGEGFDLPSLRLLAYHDKYRSLPATVQLLGRLARVSEAYPQEPTLITVADADVFPELKGIIRQLYEEDPDWTVILPGVLDEEVEQERLDREFVAELPVSSTEIDPIHLEPLKRALVYEISDGWRPPFADTVPEELREGAPFPGGGLIAYSGVSRQAGLLVVVVRYVDRPKWSSDPRVTNTSYELHLVAYREAPSSDLPSLVLMNLDREGLRHDFEEILGLDAEARRTGPKRLGEYLDGLDRISVSSVGIRSTNAAARGRAAYKNFMGSGVDRGLRMADTARGALGHVMMQVSTPQGAANAGAAIEKSKLWLSRYGSLRETSLWVDETAALLWYPRQGSAGPLLPSMDRGEELETWPDSPPLAAEPYPGLLTEGYELRAGAHTVGDLGGLSLYVNDDPTGTLSDIGLPGHEPIRIVGVMRDPESDEPQMVWDGLVHLDGTIEADPDLAAHRGYAAPLQLCELFARNPPTIYFLDGSTTVGPIRYGRASATIFSSAQLTPIDWTPADITAETRSTAAARTPPTLSVHEHLEAYLLERPRQGEHRWILCNDGTDEIADYLTIEELGSGEVVLGLWHAKAALGAPSVRVQDFQVVSAQAIRSRRQFTSASIWERIGTALAGNSYPPATLVDGSDDIEELRRRLGYGVDEEENDPSWQRQTPVVRPMIGIVQPGLGAGNFSSQLAADPVPSAAQSLRELFAVLADMAVADGGDLVLLVSP